MDRGRGQEAAKMGIPANQAAPAPGGEAGPTKQGAPGRGPQQTLAAQESRSRKDACCQAQLGWHLLWEACSDPQLHQGPPLRAPTSPGSLCHGVDCTLPGLFIAELP